MVCLSLKPNHILACSAVDLIRNDVAFRYSEILATAVEKQIGSEICFLGNQIKNLFKPCQLDHKNQAKKSYTSIR